MFHAQYARERPRLKNPNEFSPLVSYVRWVGERNIEGTVVESLGESQRIGLVYPDPIFRIESSYVGSERGDGGLSSFDELHTPRAPDLPSASCGDRRADEACALETLLQ